MNPTQSQIDKVTDQLARTLADPSARKNVDGYRITATAPMSDEGWIRNTGTEPVVLDGYRLDVKYRRGNIVRGAGPISGGPRWSLIGADGDIEFYRLVLMIRAVGDAPTPPDAPTLLDAAAGHMRDRAATYDQPTGERSMGRAVQALNAILGRQALTESEGWLLLQVLKDVRDRQRTTPHRDSLEDAIAYAALKAEARLAEGGAA
mgnify:FL=1